MFHDYNIGEDWHIPAGNVQYQILLLVTQGELVYSMEKEQLHLKKGDILFIKPGTLRSAWRSPSRPHEMYSVHFTCRQGELSQWLQDIQRGGYQKLCTSHYYHLKQQFSNLIQQWTSKQSYYDLYCSGTLLQMMSMIGREYERQHHPSRKVKLVDQLQEYLQQHYRSSLKVEDLSRIVERTPNYVSTIFKEVVGYTPLEYMHRLRISEAQDLLLNTQMTIAAIADYLGYCDQSYFGYMYKKLTGAMPSSFAYVRKGR